MRLCTGSGNNDKERDKADFLNFSKRNKRNTVKNIKTKQLSL